MLEVTVCMSVCGRFQWVVQRTAPFSELLQWAAKACCLSHSRIVLRETHPGLLKPSPMWISWCSENDSSTVQGESHDHSSKSRLGSLKSCTKYLWVSLKICRVLLFLRVRFPYNGLFWIITKKNVPEITNPAFKKSTASISIFGHRSFLFFHFSSGYHDLFFFWSEVNEFIPAHSQATWRYIPSLVPLSRKLQIQTTSQGFNTCGY